MGCYTTLLHEGREYQFKTGYDDYMEVVKVGDKLTWSPDPFWPGGHVDGVHDALGDRDSVWVIVKDCTVVAVEPRASSVGEDVLRLEKQYGITDPPRELWTEEQWQEQADRKAKAEADYKAYCDAQGVSGPAAVFSYYIHCKLRETSVIDKILPTTKVQK